MRPKRSESIRITDRGKANFPRKYPLNRLKARELSAIEAAMFRRSFTLT